MRSQFPLYETSRCQHLLGRRQLLWGACCLASQWAIGCGPRRARAVNVELARATLIQVLEHWKQGGTIDELRSARPEIVVQEPLWTADRPLLAYVLAEEGRAEDANWYCEVELSFTPATAAAAGATKSSTKKVTYVVGTDPVLTVFHAIV